MKLSTESLARSAAKHPWLSIAAWGLLLVVGVALVITLLGSATTEGQGDFTNNPEAKTAEKLLEDSGLREEQRDTEIVVIQHPTLTADSPEFQARINDVHSRIVALGPDTLLDPTQVPNPAQMPAEDAAPFISTDSTAVRIPMTLAGDLADASKTVEPILKIADEEATDGFTIGVAGQGSYGVDFREVSESDLMVGESIGIFAALLILLVVFRAVGSVWIPIVVAMVGILLTFATVAVLGQFYDNFPFFVTNFVTMIGLAVGIDYTLFIVARYREERSRGRSKMDAITYSSATASRAVLFSGFTVVFALIGMLIVPTTIFFAMALGAIIVVIFTVLLALTFLPAVLSLMGDRVNAWRVPFLPKSDDHDDTRHGFWNWMTRTVLRQPVIFMVLTFAALVALAIPYFNINLGFNGVETLPDDFRAKQTFDVLLSKFPRGQGLGDVATLDIVVPRDADSDANRAALDRLTASLDSNAAFGGAEPYQVSSDGTVGLLPVTLAVSSDSDEADQFVRDLRGSYLPAANFPNDVLVGGMTAFNVDFFDLVDTWTPIVLAVVLSLSFVLLTVVFRSLVVPVKAIILNLLSVGAAYGLLVLVFQEGYGTGILGFQQVPVIEAWIPLFLFAVLFGLSMDYEVFLLSRIRERYDQTGDNSDAVAFGLRSTAAIITGAALIMVAVFAGFATGRLVMFQQLGFGLGVAILIDATVIRSILVPATMKLLGRANWWFPGFLHWLPDVRVEGERAPARQSPSPEGAD